MTQNINKTASTRLGDATPLTGTSIANEQTPLLSAIAALPQRYMRVLTKPAVATYKEEIGQGSWSVVWLQLLVWAILDGLLGFLVNMIASSQSGAALTARTQLFSLITSIGLIAIVPILFFLILGLIYVLTRKNDASAQGTFLDLCNAAIQVEAPLGIASKLLALIPIVGRVLNSVLSLYGIVLIVLVIMAVRQQKAGRSIFALLLAGVGAMIPAAVVYFVLIRMPL